MENECSKVVVSLVELHNSILVLSKCDMENNEVNVGMHVSCNFLFLTVP